MKIIVGIILALALLFSVQAYNNGLGRTPQMGWNSWNKFYCDINQTLIRQTADRLVELGLARKGYVYLNLDDCWQLQRNQTTHQIIEDRRTFPSGIPALSKYVHQKGLKFGLYSDAGIKTCEGRPGGYGHQAIDAKTYARWEVDYLKYDNCYNEGVPDKLRYYRMHVALNESGRAIFFSMCSWGENEVHTWAEPYANSWRTTGDIEDSWESFLKILDKQVGLQKYAGPGGWNDPDMLEVGNGGMTYNQYYAHFALWAALKAPLLIGCSLTDITNQTLQILGNEELIAVNQDPLGVQAKRIKEEIYETGKRDYWVGPLSENRYIVIFFNRGDDDAEMIISLTRQLHLDFDSYTQRDPIRHKNHAVSTNVNLAAMVVKHSVEVRILSLSKGQKSI